MLQFLVSTANFVQTFISYAFYFSFNTGKFLVTTLCVITEKIAFSIKSVAVFIGVLLESFSMFLQDVIQGFQQFSNIVSHTFEVTFKSVSSAILSVADAIYSVYCALIAVRDAIYLIFTSVFTCLAYSVSFLKKLFVLFGSGIWFSFTLIPLSILYFFSVCLTFMRKLYEEIVDIIMDGLSSFVSLLKDFYNFTTDIPLESLAGLLIAASFVYIFMKFYIIILSQVSTYLYQRYLYIKHWVTFLFRRIFSHEQTEERIVSPLQRRGAIRRRDDSRRPFIESRRQIRSSSSEKTTYDVPEDRCCVICQERLKCVVLLPCKHLCLCSTCVQRLKRYDDKCPVCRNNIDSEMRIFI